MRVLTLSLLATVTVASSAGAQPHLQQQTAGTTAELRGVSAAGAMVVWTSGTGGTYGRTIDGGATWHFDTVPGASALDFRDVQAVDGSTAYLMSSGDAAKGQARIYKTTDGGRSWMQQYNDSTPGLFLDAMAFWDADHGIVLSDPVGGHFVLLTTSDGGTHWTQIPATRIPPIIPGEAAFAASGSCIAVQGASNVWFVTGGGASARVFHSVDRGRTWTVSVTPVSAGNAASGLFSVAFADGAHGVAVGGDYRASGTAPDAAHVTAARTDDGGLTWVRLADAAPKAYLSAVAYAMPRDSATVIAVGTLGSVYSTDSGAVWHALDPGSFNAITFASDGSGWLVGTRGRIARLTLTPMHPRQSPTRQ